MASAQSILFQINSTNYSNPIFTIYKPTIGCSGFITTLRLTINLNSIETAEFPYIPDETPSAVLQQILDEVAQNTEFKEIILYLKKGAEPWVERAPIRIFNKDPYYDVNLMRFFSDANTIDVSEDLSLGIQVKGGSGNILTATDTILVWGTVVEEKKNNGNEELAAAIEALQLALYGRLTDLPPGTLLGRNTERGTVEAIPQSQFLLKSDLVATAHTFKVAASALQSISAGAWTKVNFNTEINDSNNQVINGRLTALTAEIWRFTVYVTFRITTNTRLLLSIFKNGAEVGGTSRILDVVANTGDFGFPQNVFEFPLVSGDFLEVYCYTNSGCTIFGDSSLNTVFWSGKRIS